MIDLDKKRLHIQRPMYSLYDTPITQAIYNDISYAFYLDDHLLIFLEDNVSYHPEVDIIGLVYIGLNEELND